MWAEESGILTDCQFGFRGAHRATDAIFVLNTLIEQSKWKRKKLFCRFVDFRNAFDSMDPQLLWNKLWNLIGISTKVLTVLQSMYQSAQSAVYTQRKLIAILESDRGAPSVPPCSHCLSATSWTA